MKYIIRHFIFVFFIYFFYHSSCRKDHFTVLNLKFGTQDFTDPRSTKDPADPQWFVFVVLTSQVFPLQKGQFLLSLVVWLYTKFYHKFVGTYLICSFTNFFLSAVPLVKSR